MTSVIIVTTLYPAKQQEDARSRSHAVKHLVEYVSQFGIRVEVVVRPVQLIQWKNLRIQFSRDSVVDGVRVLTIPVLVLPKFGTIEMSLRRFKRKLQTFPCEVVVGHLVSALPAATWLAQRRRAPLVMIYHKSDLWHLSSIRKGNKTGSIVYARSPVIHRKLKEAGVESNGIIFSGVSTRYFPKHSKRVAKEAVRIITVARLISLKNIDINLAALERLPVHLNWHYTIVGDGPIRQTLERAVDESDLRDKVSFTGWLETEAVIQELHSSDVFVMASAPETFGLVYLEAMAAGCIVIGAKGWGIDGIINDGRNGFLVEPRSIGELERRLRSILRDFPENVRVESMKTASQYTQLSASENYARVIKQGARRAKEAL